MEDNTYLEYLRVRSIIEEHNSNIFVENYIIDNIFNFRILYIRFFVEGSYPEKIVMQLQIIARVIKVDLILFAVGRSHYLCYVADKNFFYNTKKLGKFSFSVSELNKLLIQEDRVLDKIRCLFLEDKRKRIISELNERDKISQ